MGFTITRFRCPHCRHLLGTSVQHGLVSGDLPIGEPGILSCPSCSGPIRNGLAEWDDIGLTTKVWALLVTSIAILVYGGVLGVIAAMVAMAITGSDNHLMILTIILLVPSALFLLNFVGLKSEIIESRNRVRQKSAQSRNFV